MDRRFLLTYVGLVAVSTLTVTSGIIGLLAVLSGDAPGLMDRIPYYVFFMAVVFTALVFILERKIDDGWKIITTALAVGALAFALTLLGVEGALDAVENPERVMSNISFYFLSAGLLCTSIMYWAVNHWREFVSTGATGHRRR